MLARSDVEQPKVADYFDTILQYCVDTNWGKRRSAPEAVPDD
jgi:hypothetical protein